MVALANDEGVALLLPHAPQSWFRASAASAKLLRRGAAGLPTGRSTEVA